jgi:hypothetical protein
MDAVLRQWVRDRAGNCCEYCGLQQQQASFALFHVDHIVARQHGGVDTADNLALACHRCNRHKGPNLTGIDPDSNEIIRLFNPRQDVWDEHFALQGVLMVGLTSVGRTTVRVLAMNAPDRVQLRTELLENNGL